MSLYVKYINNINPLIIIHPRGIPVVFNGHAPFFSPEGLTTGPSMGQVSTALGKIQASWHFDTWLNGLVWNCYLSIISIISIPHLYLLAEVMAQLGLDPPAAPYSLWELPGAVPGKLISSTHHTGKFCLYWPSFILWVNYNISLTWIFRPPLSFRTQLPPGPTWKWWPELRPFGDDFLY